MRNYILRYSKNKKYVHPMPVERNINHHSININFFLKKKKKIALCSNFIVHFFYISLSSNINFITNTNNHHLNHQPSQLYLVNKKNCILNKYQCWNNIYLHSFCPACCLWYPHIKNIIEKTPNQI